MPRLRVFSSLVYLFSQVLEADKIRDYNQLDSIRASSWYSRHLLVFAVCSHTFLVLCILSISSFVRIRSYNLQFL